MVWRSPNQPPTGEGAHPGHCRGRRRLTSSRKKVALLSTLHSAERTAALGVHHPIIVILSGPSLSLGHLPRLSQLVLPSSRHQGLGDPRALGTVLVSKELAFSPLAIHPSLKVGTSCAAAWSEMRLAFLFSLVSPVGHRDKHMLSPGQASSGMPSSSPRTPARPSFLHQMESSSC